MKKFFLMLMVMVMLTTTSFATFSDLPEGHWAKGVVEEMVKAGIISGYTDGTFRPSKEISKIESLILLSRVAGLNNYPDEATKFLDKYTSTLAKYTTQYKKDVAYLLGVNILKENDLDNLLLSDKINSPLTREEMAILVTKAMGKETDATKNSIIVLPFSDTSSISSSAKPYVYYVYSEGIMAGMTDGSFSPKTYLTRAQAASILQRIYKKIDIKPVISETPSTTTPSTSTPSATSFVTGTITKIDKDASSVWIKSGNETEEYEYDENTKFYVSSKEMAADAMKVNATVTATLTDDLYITSMNISEGAKITTKTVEGIIYAASAANKTISITTDGQRIAYTYDNNTTYKLDGKSSTLINAIKKDYEIKLKVDSTKYIISAEVTSPEKDEDERIIGEIIKASTKYGYIVIEDEDGDEYILMDDYIEKYEANYDDEDEDYYFDDDTEFEYNSDSKSYSKIATTSYLYKEGNYVAITIGKNDFITVLEVATKKSALTEDDEDSETNEDEIIGEVFKASKKYGYIVIEDVDSGKEYIIMDDVIGEYAGNYDDEDEDFYFNDDTDFYYEGDEKSYSKIAITSYLYKEGNYVRIILDDEYVEELEVASTKSKLKGSSDDDDDEDYLSSEDMLNDNYLVGKIIDIENDEIILETDDGEEFIIDVLEDAILLDYTDDDPENDYVFYVDAYEDEDIETGDRVMVILCDDEETALIIFVD